MKQLAFIMLAFLFMVSCTSKTIFEKPDDLIEKEEMINIWVDIFIARGAKSVKTIELRKGINYLPLVFEKYNIDSTQLSESNLYYTSKIDEYQKMFEQAKNRLKKQKEIYQPKSELDSISENSRAKIEPENN